MACMHMCGVGPLLVCVGLPSCRAAQDGQQRVSWQQHICQRGSRQLEQQWGAGACEGNLVQQGPPAGLPFVCQQALGQQEINLESTAVYLCIPRAKPLVGTKQRTKFVCSFCQAFWTMHAHACSTCGITLCSRRMAVGSGRPSMSKMAMCTLGSCNGTSAQMISCICCATCTISKCLKGMCCSHENQAARMVTE